MKTEDFDKLGVAMGVRLRVQKHIRLFNERRKSVLFEEPSAAELEERLSPRNSPNLLSRAAVDAASPSKAPIHTGAKTQPIAVVAKSTSTAKSPQFAEELSNRLSRSLPALDTDNVTSAPKNRSPSPRRRAASPIQAALAKLSPRLLWIS